MRHWKFALAAAVANGAVLAACLGLYGAGSAARNTARFAVLIFLFAFAAPGLRRWLRFPEPALLIAAYVAAQMVHYAAVALLHTVFAKDPLQLGIPQIAIILLGFTLTMLMGLTASARNKSAIAIHKLTLYVVFLILAADYSSHPNKSMRFAALPVFAALVLRWIPGSSAKASAVAGTP
jgi:hypothetical protein